MRFDSGVALVLVLAGVLITAVGAAWSSGSSAHGAAGALQLAVAGMGLVVVAAGSIGWVFFRVVLSE